MSFDPWLALVFALGGLVVFFVTLRRAWHEPLKGLDKANGMRPGYWLWNVGSESVTVTIKVGETERTIVLPPGHCTPRGPE